VIIFPAGYGCLYYFDRLGWVGRESFGRLSHVAPEDVPSPLYVTARIVRGAHWAVYFTDTSPGNPEPELEAFLRTTYARAQLGAGFEIFDLTHPAASPPPPAPTVEGETDEAATGGAG
jgi:hypothetical protein